MAVFLVVAYHAFSRGFRGGFIGVDVFFVLSGYLITGILVREVEERGRLSLSGFYARRARRLLPASAVVLMATVIGCALLATPLMQYRAGASGVATSLYVSNLWFLQQAVDYFAPALQLNPFLHTWSLAVEEQFYLVFPAVIALCVRGARSRRTLLVVLWLITAASFAACFYWTWTDRRWAFFSSPARAWEFGTGAIAFLMGSTISAIPGKLRAFAGWLGLGAILGASLSFNGEESFPGVRALVPVVGTVAVVVFRDSIWGAARLLELPALQWLGKLSYSIYLWHWPVLTIAREVNPGISARSRLACVAAAFVLAIATHYLVENPIRFSRYLSTRSRLTLALAGGLTLLVASLSFGWQHAVARMVETPERQTILKFAMRGFPVREACPVGYEDLRVTDCIRGNAAGRYTIALFGDSHAMHWEPAFEAMAIAHGWRLLVFSKPSCPAPRMTVRALNLNREFTECDIWREAAIRRIVALRPDALVIANASIFAESPNARGDFDEWRRAYRRTLTSFEEAALPTLVLRDTPRAGFEVPYCVAGLLTPRWQIFPSPNRIGCGFTRASGMDSRIYRAERESGAGMRHVSFLDLTDLFCEGSVCPATKNGFLVYRDASHLSLGFSTSLAPALSQRLTPLLPLRGTDFNNQERE